MPGLGRRFAPDHRDLDHPVSARLKGGSPLEYRYWNANGWWGDQGNTPQCVAYAWTHWLEDGPVIQPGPAPVIQPGTLYHDAQQVDEWPGDNYEGTSVRAGAKVLQARGYITSYSWAFTVDEMVAGLLELGPIVVGTNWYDSMFDPDEIGFLHIAGAPAGGHAYKLDGVNLKQSIFRIKNSWGRAWSNNGFAFISFDDMARLLSEDGEACIAHEAQPGSAT